MVIKIHRENDSAPGWGEAICDAEECDTASPPAADLLKHGGLIGLGWHCTGGAHFCPKHPPQEENSK